MRPTETSQSSLQSVDVRLALSAEQVLTHYQGHYHSVIAPSLDGRRIQIPLSALRAHVSHEGLYGLFRIHFHANGRYHSINRLAG